MIFWYLVTRPIDLNDYLRRLILFRGIVILNMQVKGIPPVCLELSKSFNP